MLDENKNTIQRLFQLKGWQLRKRRSGARPRVQALPSLHVLPKGLMRVRHYGFLANRCRRRRLAQIRQALIVAETAPEDVTTTNDEDPVYTCSHCRQPTLRVTGTFTPQRLALGRLPSHRRQRYRA